MSLQSEIENFFTKVNKELKTKKYTREELRKAWILLRVESAYIQYIMKNKIGMNGDSILINQHRIIITDYIRLIKQIDNKIINKNPEVFYLIIAYLRILEKDNKILLEAKTKFISTYINSIQNNKVLDSPLNVISLSMELGDNFKSIFSKNVYKNSNDFTYIKNIMSIVLNKYNELQSSRDNSSGSEESTNSSETGSIYNNDVFVDDEIETVNTTII